MSSTTPNLGLVKMASSETIGQWSDANNGANGNLDKIDTAIGSLNSQIVQKTSVNVTSISGANSSEFIVNLMQRLASTYNLSEMQNGDVIAGRAEWAGVDYVHFTATKVTGTTWNVFVTASSRIVTAYYNASSGTVTSATDVVDQLKTSYENHDDWLASAEAGSGSVLYIQKMGKLRILNLRTSSRTHSDADTLATLPAGYRPIVTTDVPCWINGTGVGVCRIQSDGVVRTLALPSGTASAGRVYLYATYLTA